MSAGPSKLPELGKELGKTVKSFQTAAKARMGVHLHLCSCHTFAYLCCSCCCFVASLSHSPKRKGQKVIFWVGLARQRVGLGARVSCLCTTAAGVRDRA